MTDAQQTAVMQLFEDWYWQQWGCAGDGGVPSLNREAKRRGLVMGLPLAFLQGLLLEGLEGLDDWWGERGSADAYPLEARS